MHNQTRLAYNQFLSRIAQINGVADATQKFAVEPSVEQRLVEKVQESSAFLSLINSHIVDAMEGEKVHIGVNSTIAGRTDTSGRRVTSKHCPLTNTAANKPTTIPTSVTPLSTLGGTAPNSKRFCARQPASRLRVTA